jgi:type I restriction enzyme R subunit
MFLANLADIGKDHRERTFAIIIDEAHSSQGGKTTAAVSMALAAGGAAEEDETIEDTINRIIESKKMLPNASYFAFTATPKNKTLQMFGEPVPGAEGTAYRPFHSYTMKQATQERFIVDVLENFTPVRSYYKLMKTIEDDPEFDAKRASKKLRAFVEGNVHAIRLKAEIMVDHFHSQVVAKHKISGQARAMVVTSSILRCIEYYHAISDYLAKRMSPTRRSSRSPASTTTRATRSPGPVSTASLPRTSPTGSRKIRTGSSCAPTSSRPATTSRCCTPCTSTRPCRV